MSDQWGKYIQIVQSVVKPALGCTEPISAAYASACAAQYLGKERNSVKSLKVEASDNLYKNSMGVYVPKTGRIGLKIAAAVGFVAGNFENGLEVLKDITPADVEKAQSLIDADKVDASVTKDAGDEFIFCRVTVVTTQDNEVVVTISGGHTNVTQVMFNGSVVFQETQDKKQQTAAVCEGADISLEQIFEFVENVPFEDIEFILEAKTLNMALAQEGMRNDYGLKVGKSLSLGAEKNMFGGGLPNDIIMLTSAASDARMGGASLPAMSNFGSGNQGIAITVPVAMTAEKLNSTDDVLARALMMAHLSAIYMKSHYPPLSAFCGNTVSSSAAAMAMVYLSGGSFEESCAAIQNVLSDTSGMICDGAKSTCALKVCSSTSAAIKGAIMATSGIAVKCQGVISEEVENSIRNIGHLVTHGMRTTDNEILTIMTS